MEEHRTLNDPVRGCFCLNPGFNTIRRFIRRLYLIFRFVGKATQMVETGKGGKRNNVES